MIPVMLPTLIKTLGSRFKLESEQICINTSGTGDGRLCFSAEKRHGCGQHEAADRHDCHDRKRGLQLRASP